MARITKKALQAMTAGELAKFISFKLYPGRPSKEMRE